MSEHTAEIDVPDHEHVWQDTGFASVEDCAVEGCRVTRSGGEVIDPTRVTPPEVGRS